MKLIIRERGTGKSLELLHASEMTGYRIITHTEQHAHELYEAAKKLNLDIPQPTSAYNYKSQRYKDAGILIDDVNIILPTVLEYYFQTPVVGAAMSIPTRNNK